MEKLQSHISKHRRIIKHTAKASLSNARSKLLLHRTEIIASFANSQITCLIFKLKSVNHAPEDRHSPVIKKNALGSFISQISIPRVRRKWQVQKTMPLLILRLMKKNSENKILIKTVQLKIHTVLQMDVGNVQHQNSILISRIKFVQLSRS